MICPTCGTHSLIHETRDLHLQGKTVLGVTGDFCPGCGEVVLDAGEAAKVSAALLTTQEHN